jgi:hypothetical protein
VCVTLLICTVSVNSVTFCADTNQCNYVNILIIVGPVNKSTGKKYIQNTIFKNNLWQSVYNVGFMSIRAYIT